MAASDALDAEPRATQNAVGFHRGQKITRAARLIPAAGIRLADEEREQRREQELVPADEEPDEVNHAKPQICLRITRICTNLQTALIERSALLGTMCLRQAIRFVPHS